VGVFMTCARLVALKSPFAPFTVTPLRSMSAFTVVKRTSQSLRMRLSFLYASTEYQGQRTIGP
jgi:hypothetical protein